MDDAQLIRLLKALADKKRLRMVQEIAASQELSCSQIGARIPLSQPTISHHLKILVDAGILSVRQAGQQHFISVNRRVLVQLGELLPRHLTPPSRRRRTGTTKPTSHLP
jgi:ArsR family transcriptional regulator